MGDHMALVRAAADAMSSWTGGAVPRVMVVLGSGLGGVADAIAASAEAPFSAMPGFADSGVAGHAGRFVFGHLENVPVLAMVGRLHLYEGHPVERVVLPVRAAAVLGCEVFIATNAAGGVSDRLSVGQPMILTDHINLLGVNPLTGPNLDVLGVRFPPMSDAYSERLQVLAVQVAAEQGVDLAEGVYAAVPGPNYETDAEVRALRVLGADAVGMSTVPEVIAARHAGMEVAAFSLIANVAAGVEHGHDDVLAASSAGAPVLAELLTGMIARL